MADEIVSEIGHLVESLTENPNLELKDEVMTKIKKICKVSLRNVSHVFHAMMIQLRKDHSEIRYIMLLAMDELFQRCSMFRTLTESNLEEFLELTLETNSNKLLPPPRAVANRLKLKAQHVVQCWDTKFGYHCKKLTNAFSFLKSTGRFHHLGVPAISPALPVRPRLSVQNATKIFIMKHEMESMRYEIENAALEMEACFQRLLPSPDNLFDPDDIFGPNIRLEQSPSDEVQPEPTNAATSEQSTLRDHGIHNVRSSLNISIGDVSTPTVIRTYKNEPVIEKATNLYRRLAKIYLPDVIKWLSVFSKDDNCYNLVKKTIDLKRMLQEKVRKFDSIKFEDEVKVETKSKSTDDEDEDIKSNSSDNDFEEVPEKEGYESNAVEQTRGPNVKEVTPSNGTKVIKTVVPTCLGMLPSGKPCPRQDLHKCPFHGLMDDEKDESKKIFINPFQRPTSSMEIVPDWQDPALLEDLKAITGVDLKMPEKGKKRKAKQSVRTDIKKIKDTSYNRLIKKLFKKRISKK